MEYEGIKGGTIVGFISNGHLATSEPCYQEIQVEIKGKLYEIKQTSTKHPVMYLSEMHFVI